MGAGQCNACGSDTPYDARFCPACGTTVGAHVVDLSTDLDDPAVEAENPARESGSLIRRILVPLGVAGLFGLLAWVLFQPGAEDPEAIDPDADVVAIPTAPPTPTPEPSPEPTPEPPGNPALTPRPAGAAVPIETTESSPTIDPSLLPLVDATHLYLLDISSVHVFAFETGMWSTHDVGSRRNGTLGWALDGGVALEARTELLLLEPDGTTRSLVDVADAIVIGSSEALVYVADYGSFDDPTRSTTLRAIDANGPVWEDVLTRWQFPSGVTADGRIVYQAGGSVLLADGTSQDVLANGLAIGVIDNWVAVHDCSTLDTCSTVLINVVSGDRVTSPFANAEVRSGALVASDGVETRTFSIDAAGTITEFAPGEEPPGVIGPNSERSDIDSSGVTALFTREGIELVDEPGSVLATIPLPAMETRGVPDALVLVSAG